MENSVYYKMTEEERTTMNKVTEETCTNYDMEGLFIPADSLMCAIKDLMTELHHKEEELEDTIRDRNDNYRPIPYEEQI